MNIYTRQQQSILREYTSVLERNLLVSLDLIKDIAVDLETSLLQAEHVPSKDKKVISLDESMITLDENYRDLLIELKTIKSQESAMSRINFEDENWYNTLQQELDRDVDEDIDQDPITQPHYLDFRQKVWEVGNPGTRFDEEEDDELRIVNATITTKCPLTQAPLLEPYTAPCNHSFSKAIFQMVSNREIPCPVSGCQERFGKDDLRLNKGLGKRVGRELERLEVEAIRGRNATTAI